MSLLACGKAGAPLPPVRLTPERPSELSLAQRGNEVEIVCRAPRVSVDGQRLGVVDVELLLTTDEPDLSKATPRARRMAPGERLLESVGTPPPAGSVLRVAARARMDRRLSDLTEVVTLEVRKRVPSPGDFTAERVASGVRLRWSASAESPAGVRYWLYRRAKSAQYADPVRPEPLAATSFVDEDSETADAACYVARAVVAVLPTVESSNSSERCVEAKAAGPPGAPQALLAVPGPGVVELSWSCSAPAVITGYRIYRATAEGSLELRGEIPATQCSYRDADLPAAPGLTYAVTSVDSQGREGPAASSGMIRPRGK